MTVVVREDKKVFYFRSSLAISIFCGLGSAWLADSFRFSVHLKLSEVLIAQVLLNDQDSLFAQTQRLDQIKHNDS